MTNKSSSIPIEEDIDSIFKDTSIEPAENFNFTLHQLRRDVERCLGTGFYKDKVTFVSYWPGICAILTGIDLLATYFAPVSNPLLSTHPTKKYKGFCNQILNLDDHNEINEAFYQFRCGMLHHYSLISEPSDHSGKKYCFKLNIDQGATDFITFDATTKYYTIFIFALYESFNKACSIVRDELKKNCHIPRYTTPITTTIKKVGLTFYDQVTSGCMIYIDP